MVQCWRCGTGSQCFATCPKWPNLASQFVENMVVKQPSTFGGTYRSQQVPYNLANYRLLFQMCIRTKIGTDNPHDLHSFHAI